MNNPQFHVSDGADHIGEELAVSDWTTLTQEQVDMFATATKDPDWMHVDVERSRRESPYGTTIVQGFLMMSLVIHLNPRDRHRTRRSRLRAQLWDGPGTIYRSGNGWF